MSSWLGQFHDFTKKYDPLGHALVDLAHKSSTSLVNETSKGLSKVGGALGISTALPDYWTNQSQKDKDNFSRWGENTLGSAAAIYGGMSALGGSGSGASSLGGYAEQGGGFVGNGEFLGSSGSMGGLNAGSFGNLGKSLGGGTGSSQQQAGSDNVARQLALAEMLRRHKDEQDAASEMPGWVNTSGAF